MTVVEYLFVTSNSPNAVIAVCGLITAAQRSAARLAFTVLSEAECATEAAGPVWEVARRGARASCKPPLGRTGRSRRPPSPHLTAARLLWEANRRWHFAHRPRIKSLALSPAAGAHGTGLRGPPSPPATVTPAAGRATGVLAEGGGALARAQATRADRSEQGSPHPGVAPHWGEPHGGSAVARVTAVAPGGQRRLKRPFHAGPLPLRAAV